MTERDLRHHRRIAALAVFIVVAALLAAGGPLREAIQRILESSRGIMLAHPIAGKLLFMLLGAVSAMLAFFSTAIIVPVAVYAWGEWTTVLLLWVSWLFGGLCSYAIGRKLGSRVARWFMPKKRFDYYASRIKHDAKFPTILLFQLALPSEIPGYVLGAVKYPFATFLAARALAELPFAVGAVYLGESFIKGNFALLIALGALGLGGIFVAMHFLHRKLG